MVVTTPPRAQLDTTLEVPNTIVTAPQTTDRVLEAILWRGIEPDEAPVTTPIVQQAQEIATIQVPTIVPAEQVPVGHTIKEAFHDVVTSAAALHIFKREPEISFQLNEQASEAMIADEPTATEQAYIDHELAVLEREVAALPIDIKELYSELPEPAPWTTPEDDIENVIDAEVVTFETTSVRETFKVVLQKPEHVFADTPELVDDPQVITIATTISERLTQAEPEASTRIDEALTTLVALTEQIIHADSSDLDPVKVIEIKQALEVQYQVLLELLNLEVTPQSVAAIRAIVMQTTHTLIGEQKAQSEYLQVTHERKFFALEVAQASSVQADEQFDLHKLLGMFKPLFTRTVSL